MLLPVFRLMSRLPLPALHALGRAGGRLQYALSRSWRERLKANAQVAGFTDARQHRRMAAQAGAGLLELAHIWLRTDESIARVHCPDVALIAAALAQGRGIMFLTPHLGGFELTARWYAAQRGITVLYRPPRQPALRELVESLRAQPGLEAVPTNMSGVRRLVRALREGQAIGMLPDQVPGAGEGAWAPFFGRPAYTMTLPARLVELTGCVVLAAWAEREPAGRGWTLRLRPVTPRQLGLDKAELAHRAAALNLLMESLIRECPEQYLWAYNRYKVPAGESEPPA
jgi:KDO2-lipid IV(A) lauroyltransferase